MILPILNYSSEVWGFHKANNIEHIHTQYCKRILQVKRCTQNDFVYGVLGRFNLAFNRYIRIVKYWLKITSSEDLKSCKIIYEVLKTDAVLYPHKVSWVTLLQHLLSPLGFYAVWLAQGVGKVILLFMFSNNACVITMYRTENQEMKNHHVALFLNQLLHLTFSLI